MEKLGDLRIEQNLWLYAEHVEGPDQRVEILEEEGQKGGRVEETERGG